MNIDKIMDNNIDKIMDNIPRTREDMGKGFSPSRVKDAEREALKRQTDAWLAQGGVIEVIGSEVFSTAKKNFDGEKQ